MEAELLMIDWPGHPLDGQVVKEVRNIPELDTVLCQPLNYGGLEPIRDCHLRHCKVGDFVNDHC